MKSRYGYFSFLLSIFSSLCASKIVQITGLLSIMTLISSWTLWPLLNETDLYYLLYLIDFLNYAVFLVFFAAISKTTSLSRLDSHYQRSWASIILTASVLSIFNLVLQEIKDNVSGTTVLFLTTLGTNFLGFLFFNFLITYSAKKERLSSSVLEAMHAFLRGIHWFILYYLAFIAIGALANFLPVLLDLTVLVANRLYTGIVDAVLRYASCIGLVALILLLITRGRNNSKGDSQITAVVPQEEPEK